MDLAAAFRGASNRGKSKGMGSVATDLSADLSALGGGADASRAVHEDDRRFFRYLLIALALHALLLVRIHTSEPRRLGAPDGANDAISVSIITERDLNGRATVEDRAAGVPVPPTPQAQPAKPVPTPPAPPVQQPSPPEPEAAALPPPPPPAAAEPTPAEKPAPPANLRPTLPDEAVEPAPKDAKPEAAAEKTETQKPSEQVAKSEKSDETAKPVEKPEPADRSKPAEKAAEAKPKPPAPEKKPAKKTETAKLDLSPPAIFQAPVGGGGAGVQRPAGITRSGENDDFARGVIRALQTTMPQLANTFGRVTVRIELNMKGNLVRTTVVKPSNVGGLDQSVVFATQQASFPFPPGNAVPADLIFFVTYIYR